MSIVKPGLKAYMWTKKSSMRATEASRKLLNTYSPETPLNQKSRLLKNETKRSWKSFGTRTENVVATFRILKPNINQVCVRKNQILGDEKKNVTRENFEIPNDGKGRY